MGNSAHTPNDNNNDAHKGSDHDGEQKPEELNIDDPTPGSSSEGDSEPGTKAGSPSGGELVKQSGDSPEADTRALSLDDIDYLPFHPHVPSRGPMRDFVVQAHKQLGLPVSHAWALWLYVTMAHCGHSILYDDGSVERRLSMNVVLAGDDVAGFCRRLAIEAIERSETIDVVTDPAVLQLEEALERLTSDIRLAVVDTGSDNIFARWHKTVSKQVLSLDQIFDQGALNDYLRNEIRASAMPPASVPALLACKLKDVLSDKKFPFEIYRNSLVVPSFGCAKSRVFSVKEVDALIAILGKSLIRFPDEGVSLTLSSPAKEVLEERLDKSGNKVINLNDEGNHSHYRQAGMVSQIIALSAAYGINSSLRKEDKPFDGSVSKADMLDAIHAFDRLDRHWNGIDHFYEELTRADEVDTVYDLVLSKFKSDRYDAEGGLVVDFNKLADTFCHHPQREGQYSTRHLERNILPMIVESGLAKKLPSKSRRDRRWVFYTQKRLNRG